MTSETKRERSVPVEEANGKPPRLFGQCAVIVCVLLAFYLFLFPLPVLAADVAGFSLRNKTRFGKVVTNPLVWIAERVPPYKAYLQTSHRVIEWVYLSA